MNRRRGAWLCCAVLLCCGAVTLDAGDDAAAGRDLDAARRLVEQRQYGEALRVYETLAEWLWRDPGLVLERARVYTYADRHADAIGLFEEVRRRCPERQGELLAELGDQYTWSGQLDQAIATYHDALRLDDRDARARFGLARALAWSGRHRDAIPAYDALLAVEPANTDALVGKADSLSFLDRLEDGNRIYEQVLTRQPEHLGARNGLARNRVWQGYHRQGRDLYRETLDAHPDQPDALEGLAFAHFWDGRTDLALDALDRLAAVAPNRQAATELMDKIQYSQTPFVSQDTRFWTDKYGSSVELHRLRAGFHPDTKSVLHGTYDWHRLQSRDADNIDVHRAGLGGSYRFGDCLELNSHWYGSDYRGVDFSPLTTNTWLTLRPNDLWRFDLSYDRETLDTVLASRRRILVNSGGLAADLRPNRFLFVSGKYTHGEYSDDNEQDAFLGKAELRVWNKPYVKLYYNFYAAEWERQVDHGYFCPESFQAHTLGLYTGFEITPRLFCEMQGSTARERQDPTAENPAWFAAAGLRYRLASNWELALRGEYFDARPDEGNGANGYRRTTVFLSLTHNFGGTPGQARETSLPARPGVEY